jgi:hypothetical protein
MDSMDIDGHILASCHDRWQKVAMVIAKTAQSAGLQHDDLYDAIATRIEALVRAGKLDAVGNLNDWRHSEIRLPGS